MMDQRTRALLAGFAHEIRTPLGSIGGYAELLRLGTQGPVSEAQAEMLGRIVRNQQDVLSLLDAMMSYCAVLTGDVSLRTAVVELDSLVHGTVAACEARATEREVTIRTCASTADTASALVDPTLCGAVLSTLMDDALTHAGPSGTVDVTIEAAGLLLAVSVESSGEALDDSSAESLFEPFRRGVASRRDALALPKSRALARLCGGDVEAVTSGGRRTLRLTVPSATCVRSSRLG